MEYLGSVLGKPPASGVSPARVHIPVNRRGRSYRKRFRNFRRSHPASVTSDNQPPTNTIAVVSNPAREIGTPDDVAMGAIQTSLAVLQEGSSLAAKLPFIAPIAGLILQVLTMRDEVKQYKEECEIVMDKLARIASIIVNVGGLCEKRNLSEEDRPDSLRAILDSLRRTRELDRIGRVLKKCSKKKGIKGFLLRKDLLTKIKQCDVELSNVLQAFQAELLLDVRIAQIVVRPEAASDSGTIEATPTIHQVPNGARIFLGTKSALDALWRITLNAKELIILPGQTILGPDFLLKVTQSRAALFF